MYVSRMDPAFMPAAHLYKTTPNSYKRAKVCCLYFFHSCETILIETLLEKCEQFLNIRCNILLYLGAQGFSGLSQIIWALSVIWLLTVTSALPCYNYCGWQPCKDCLDWSHCTGHVRCFDLLPWKKKAHTFHSCWN